LRVWYARLILTNKSQHQEPNRVISQVRRNQDATSKPKSVQHKNKQSTASNDHLKNVNGRNQRKSSVDGFLCHQRSTYGSTCRRISACSTASAGDTALLLTQMFAAGCHRRENFLFLLSCVILVLFFLSFFNFSFRSRFN
jgi:hypothetical protein